MVRMCTAKRAVQHNGRAEEQREAHKSSNSIQLHPAVVEEPPYICKITLMSTGIMQAHMARRSPKMYSLKRAGLSKNARPNEFLAPLNTTPAFKLYCTDTRVSPVDDAKVRKVALPTSSLACIHIYMGRAACWKLGEQ